MARRVLVSSRPLSTPYTLRDALKLLSTLRKPYILASHVHFDQSQDNFSARYAFSDRPLACGDWKFWWAIGMHFNGRPPGD